MNLRKEAQGRLCQIRLPNYCSHDPETVVLCHLPGGGMGKKRHDIHAALGCWRCHQVVDGREQTEYSADEIRLMFLEAVIRTQEIWLQEGLICVNDR